MDNNNTTLKATPAEALRRARRHWLKGERIHLASLAAELNIGRATLFRWVGNKDLLLGEVMWSLYEPLRMQALQEIPGDGVDFVVGVYRHVNSVLLHFEPLRRFIHEDSEYALRILTSTHSTVHARTVEANSRTLRDQVQRGKIDPPLSIDSLSYFMVRLAESCLYSDIICGREPQEAELEDACTAVRVMLGGKP
ncbi:QsdR family transcriptional regulator [Marinobacter zhejiangensis]|uniref:DNA-binding transcriptional regulator, AcrR family n=1 Tax=Marinobacter zhejiangensis TaxID=488535 RepID=A0A1I4M5T5_9GAMM|nr:QsdR family transcriptional regulator [Marinobacter zhejiangensis]SFL98327.1 DNA-binding transcriptional regulator, AcrR family [Marinobacter zhejiangensis]